MLYLIAYILLFSYLVVDIYYLFLRVLYYIAELPIQDFLLYYLVYYNLCD